MMEAETGVTQPQLRNADIHQRLEEVQNRLPSRVSGGCTVLPASWSWPTGDDLRLAASRTVRQYIPVVLSHLVYGDLL